MEFSPRRTLAAVLGVSLAVLVGCTENQNQVENANDDFKDLVLLQVNPPDGTTNVFRDADIILEFTAPVDPSSVNSTTIQIRDANGGTPLGTFIVKTERVLFRPLNPPAMLAGTVYTVTCPTWPAPATLMSIENTPLMGQAPTVRNPSTFTTGAQISPDVTCPYVLSVNPPQAVVDPFIPTPYGATGVPTNANVSIRFSETIDSANLGAGPLLTDANVASCAFQLLDTNNGNVPVTGTISMRDNGRVLEFDPNTDPALTTAGINNANGYLTPNTTYQIVLWSDMATPLGIRDFAGNFLATDALCNVPQAGSPNAFTFPSGPPGPPWVGSFTWTFTTAATAATPVSDNYIEDFFDNTQEVAIPPFYNVMEVSPGTPVNPAQASGGANLFAVNTQAEWNSDSPGAVSATIASATTGTPTADPGIVVFEPGIAANSTLSAMIELNGTSPPFDNTLTGNQVGWRLQFVLLAAEMLDATKPTMHPQARAVTSGVITRLFLREAQGGGARQGPHTYNNLIVRLSHTDQSTLGALTDPIVTPTALPSFRYNHTQSGVPILPTTVARISSFSTPPAATGGFFEIPIAPNFVWNGSQNVVVDIECRGGTGIIDLVGDTSPALPAPGALRMAFGNVQSTFDNTLGLFTNNNALTPNLAVPALPSCVLTLDTWKSAVPSRRGPAGAADNGFTKPASWPATTERGVFDKATGQINSYPTNGNVNPDIDGTVAPAFGTPAAPRPPEDLVVRTGLNLSTDTSPEFGMFLYRTFTLEPGAIINVTGNNPCVIRATHGVYIGGTINADGFSGQTGASVGGLGGAGGPGGAGGGLGGNGATTGAGGAGAAGIGYDLYWAGSTAITDPINGAIPPGWGAGGGGVGGAAGASGGGGGFATAGTAAAPVGASPGGDGGVAFGSASVIFLSGGAGGGGGGGGVSTTGAGGGGGGGGGGYLQILSDRNVVVDGNAVITARGGNGGGVQGSTPGGAGGGGAGGAIYLQGTTVTFLQAGGQPGATLDSAQDLIGPVTFGLGGPSPAAGAGGDGGDGRIRIDSMLTSGSAPGQATANFAPNPPTVSDASNTAWMLIPRKRSGTPAGGPPGYTNVQCEARTMWIDTGTADPNYQSVLVQYNYNGISSATNMTLVIEACDTDLAGTPDSSTLEVVNVNLNPLATNVTQSLAGLAPTPPNLTTGRFVRFRATVTATGSPVVSPVLQNVEIQYQY